MGLNGSSNEAKKLESTNTFAGKFLSKLNLQSCGICLFLKSDCFDCFIHLSNFNLKCLYSNPWFEDRARQLRGRGYDANRYKAGSEFTKTCYAEREISTVIWIDLEWFVCDGLIPMFVGCSCFRCVPLPSKSVESWVHFEKLGTLAVRVHSWSLFVTKRFT